MIRIEAYRYKSAMTLLKRKLLPASRSLNLKGIKLIHTEKPKVFLKTLRGISRVFVGYNNFYKYGESHYSLNKRLHSRI